MIDLLRIVKHPAMI